MKGVSYPMVDTSLIGRLNDFKARVDALPDLVCSQVSYKKVGGLHFVKIGPVSGSWSIKKRKASYKPDVKPEPASVANIDPDRLARFVR